MSGIEQRERGVPQGKRGRGLRKLEGRKGRGRARHTSKYVPQTSVVRIAVAGQDLEQMLGHVPGALLDQFVVVGLGLVALRVVLAEERADDANKVCHGCC